MRKIFLVFVCISFSAIILAQKDPELTTRLDSFILATQAMDFNKILDYTYPKFFTIVPRDQMLDDLEKSLHNEDMDIRFDSIRIDSLFPIFSIAGGKYAKIITSMKMTIKLNFPKDKSESSKAAAINRLAGSMRQQYGGNKVVVKNGNITVRVNTPMIAAKDEYAKEWSFANLKDNDLINDKLFSKEVLDKFVSYN